MEQERWRQVDRLFGLALGMSGEQRRALLDFECAEDPELLREVESLLDHDRPDSFLEVGASIEASRLVLSHGNENGVAAAERMDPIGRFEVEGRLGIGGMGEVYRALDPRLGRPVALKRILAHRRDDPELHRRLRREALATSALNHPNIITVYEILELDGHDVMVTELVDGVTLRQQMDAGPLPLAVVLDVVLQIARGLEAAHAVGVVHRDVKPSNVMVRHDGLTKVLDFGIAKSSRPSGREPSVTFETMREILPAEETRPGEVFGTVTYMSPEQARGQVVDARTDIWSLGVILYELLTGEAPFRGETQTDCLVAILERDAEPPSRHRDGLPEELDEIVARALSKNADERYPRASALVADLEQVQRKMADVENSGHTSGALRGRRPARAVGRLVSLLVVLLLSGAALFAIVQWLGERRTSVEAFDSLAVLPLADVVGTEQLEYLRDGLMESVIQILAQAPDLTLASRAAAERYSSGEVDAREVGRALGVRGVLAGRFLLRDENLSVSLELIDTRDDSHVWGQRYDIPMDELASLPGRISRDVLAQLHQRLDARGLTRAASAETDDVEAYRLYLQGRYYWHKPAAEGYHKSLDFFLRAIELDPDYALAWAGLGYYYGFGAATGVLEPTAYWPRAEQAAERALERDPELAELYPLLASLTLYWHRDWASGEKKLRRAVEIFPESLNHLSFYLGQTGRLAESLQYRRRDLELLPVLVHSNRDFGHSLYFARRYDEAVERLREALLVEPSDIPTLQLLGDALARLGQDGEAVAAWHQALLLEGRSELAGVLRKTYDDSGFDAAIVALATARLESLHQERQRGGYVPAYLIARQHLLAGDRDGALTWALVALGERNRLALDLLNDPVFEPLLDEPRLLEGYHRLGLPAYATPTALRSLERGG